MNSKIESMKKITLRIAFVLGVSIFLLGIPKIASLITDWFDFRNVDSDATFAWISVHHVIQTVLFVPLFFLVKGFKKDVKFHLGVGHWRKGLKYVLIFTAIFLGYTIVVFGISLLTNTFVQYQFPLTAKNVLGYLGFQLFLSGPSEEFIFRAFAITVFSLMIGSRVFKGRVSAANLIAAIIFGLAHVGFSFSPFELRYSITQVFYAIGLGLIYGDCYERTESVLYPMMLHSISNVISVGATMLLTFLI